MGSGEREREESGPVYLREGQQTRKKRQLRADASFMKTSRCNAHDVMMKCNKEINTQLTHKTWKASGASVSGCHNTPQLTRDLAPRSRDGTGEKRKSKR